MYIHRGLVAIICVGNLCHRWFVGLKAFRMNGVKSLAKPTLNYCQLGMCEQSSLKIVSKYNNLHIRKCIWKSRTSTILFLLQYVNNLRNATQPLGFEFGASATWRHETGEQWVIWWPGSWWQQPTVWFYIDPMCIDHYHRWLFIHLSVSFAILHWSNVSPCGPRVRESSVSVSVGNGKHQRGHSITVTL